MAKTQNGTKRQYEDVGGEVEAWFRPEKGRVLEGKLIEFRHVETKFGDKILYIFSLTEPCMAVGQDDAEGEPSEWPPETIVGVFSSGGLGAMKRIKAGAQVRIECTGERDIGKGNDMRTFRVQVDKLQPGHGPAVESGQNRQTQFKSDDDIPF